MADAEFDEAYEFPPRRTRGVVLNLDASRLAYLGVALGLLVFSLYLGAWPLIVGALVAGAVLVGVGWMNVGGRTLGQWLPVAAAESWRAVVRRHVFRGGPFSPAALAEHMDLPGDLAGCRMVAAVAKDGVSRIGVVLDEQGHTATAALLTRGSSFVLEESASQVAKLDNLQGIIDSFADEESGIVRWSLMLRGLPDTSNSTERHYAEHVVIAHDHLAAQNLRMLNAAAGPQAQRHEVFVCVQFDVRRLAGEMKDLGGGDKALAAVVVDRLAEIEASVEEAEIRSEGWLTPGQYAAVIRTQFDPADVDLYDRYRAAETELDPRLAGPAATEVTWASFVHDSGVSQTLWVHELPRRKVRRNWLGVVLQHHGVRRTVTLVCEPLPAATANSMLRRERVEGAANTAIREKYALVETARTRKESGAVERQDDELAEGATPHRFHMFVTITGNSEDEARQHLRAVRRRLTRVGCQSMQLFGEQDQAFFAGALCRGLAPMRGGLLAGG